MFKLILSFILLFSFHPIYAKSTRIPQFSNEKVNIWETILYPGKTQSLKMHHHYYDRVLIALDDGVIQVTNDQGRSHLLALKKNKTYFLKKDIPHEKHIDVNITQHPIRVMIIELRY